MESVYVYSHFMITLFRDTGILSEQQYQDVEDKCQQPQSSECGSALDSIGNLTDGFNFYDIFRKCWQNGPPEPSTMSQFKQFMLR